MATSVHIPARLLVEVDRRARALKTSRNKLIIAALERELHDPGNWSSGFFEQLTPLAKADAEAFDKAMVEVRKTRRSRKAPPRL